MNSDILQAVLQPGPVSEASEYIRPILLLDVKSKVSIHLSRLGYCILSLFPALPIGLIWKKLNTTYGGFEISTTLTPDDSLHRTASFEISGPLRYIVV